MSLNLLLNSQGEGVAQKFIIERVQGITDEDEFELILKNGSQSIKNEY